MSGELIAEGPVLLSLEEGIARLRLNSPESSNSLSEALLDALVEATELCGRTDGIRCLLLSGAGDNFCAGGDVKEFAAKGEGLPDHLRKQTAQLQAATEALLRLEAPVIAAVQGWAVGGGGFGLVCAADLAIGAEGSRYMSGATRVGMAPDAGGSVTVARIVGVRKAMEIFLTNPVLSSAEALELGILNRVVPDDELAVGRDRAGAAAGRRPDARVRADQAPGLGGTGALGGRGAARRGRDRQPPVGDRGLAGGARRRDRAPRSGVQGPVGGTVDLGIRGRRAFVTGGARGIGAAICELLAAEGCEVLVGYRSSSEGPELAERIGGAAVQLDVADPAATLETVGALGGLDILVNNAGVDDMAFFTEYDPERWRPQLDVNLEGVLHVTLAALPAMQEAGYGRIVNVSSEAGRLGSYRGSVYAAAKGGVIAFTKSIARENARFGITANNVLPGPIETPMLEQNRRGPKGEQVIEAMASATLLGRIGEPEEVASAVAFLASDRAAYITGETLGVSGGMGVGA